ncbi:hypothetical protein WA026_023676 [Henosepilachna vigintioctopunctata]|uniref:Uncharacterized protein n=1 Tax=Henosepilachna vigintioctopunctata TaxID=420089 RepID=A0AAW1UCR3_9CUCU
MSLTNDRNQLILEEQELKNTWTRYIEAKFEDDRADAVYVHESTGPTILKSEVVHAFSIAKNRKASDLDEIPTKALKLILEENIDLVVKLFNSIYETGLHYIRPEDQLDIQIEKGRPQQKTNQFQAVYERNSRRKEVPISQLLQEWLSLTQPDDYSTAKISDAVGLTSTEPRVEPLNQVR